jgi:XRE family transcriptional regulator, regulator of sulfur utilization
LILLLRNNFRYNEYNKRKPCEPIAGLLAFLGNMNAISEKIRLARLKMGLSQENIADSLGISTTAYGDIERGKTDLTLNRLHQIANILMINPLTLITEETHAAVYQLEIEKLRAENEKLTLENQYLREKLTGRMILDLVREQISYPTERQKIGF